MTVGGESDSEHLSNYLLAHPPFQSMSARARTELAEAATEHGFMAGELIVDYATHQPDEIWMLRAGRVVLCADASPGAEIVDTVEPGGVFGLLPLLSAGKVAFAARAVEPCSVLRLPGELTRAVFTKPAGLSFVATSAWDTISARARVQQPSSRPVGELVCEEPVFTSPATTIRDAVRHMTDRRASYVLVRRPDNTLGIFTDSDLRTRVVAVGAGLDIPIDHVLSTPVRTVAADRTAGSVLIDLLEVGLRHIPVVDGIGRVLGVVEESDLVATATRESFLVRRSVALASTVTELKDAARRITDLAVDIFRNGTDAAGTSAIFSVVIDAVVRRALELELVSRNNQISGSFAWMTLGSIARREAMPSSDVDSALSWTTDTDASQLRRVAARVHETLDACGLPADSNGAVAYSSRFSRSARSWAEAAGQWLHDPMVDRGIIMSSLMLDARVVWGDAALHTVPAAFSCMPVEHPNALRLQLLDALSGKPRTRSLRDIVARRGGTLDLKRHALNPIVNLARWGGLTVGMVLGSTPARLAAAAGNGLLSSGDAAVLREVFDLLQRLRMAHQADQLASGLSPGDVVTLSELSPLNRSLLSDGVREISLVQRRVRTLAASTAGMGLPRG
ncbi:putative signal-transduction protein containing cAMP-binding and CBS domains [Mycobacteroides abscessus subsp. massiliense]|uniref:putative nucleotidyltransferase substrate binding domain-containing protein n=1 Tax=Mycobacteroides abscessus TaxID=36809 RepID=UPI0009A78341|nr:putative nucleotidyltransferase substrate binding domain-containing protein [Mycobacteroides abscessus]SKH59045.1 putative signal-transduction protein containing cAMP-binding and CBS domains [Mycobacteroides abscessus subsp. massiliense]SKH92964.1 putative signal-transduction protein containing cAMP-binding and CBS domains [Mycobacteroides abscessus subsp. massiliense]SKI13265.1 putative signal-transduction protein containing cAMP-binding and CBS domains [Mycobacteroides abscessus subsp. mass